MTDKHGNRIYSDESIAEQTELINTMQDDIVKKYIELGGTLDDLRNYKAKNLATKKDRLLSAQRAEKKDELVESEKKNGTISYFNYGEGAYSSIGIDVAFWQKAVIIFEFDKYGGTDGLVYGINWPSGRPEDVKISDYRHNSNWAWKNFPEPYYWWNVDTFNDIFNGKVADAFISCIKELLEIVKQQDLLL